jgi:crossover junction endonuclease EME1
MSGLEVIDLLSTDDEAPCRISGPSKGFGTKEIQVDASSTDFSFLSDNFDNNAGINGWTEKPAKRRRLTPPLGDKNNLPIPQLSHVKGTTSSSKVISRTKTTAIRKDQWVDLSDPIVSTSSPHKNDIVDHSRNLLNPPSVLNEESDDEFPDDPLSATLQEPVSVAQISKRTAALLASLKAPPQKKPPNGRKKSGDKHEARLPVLSLESEGDGGGADTVPEKAESAATSKPSRKAKLTEAEKAAKTQEKETLKAAEKVRKAREKEDEKEKKRLEKEEKARGKQIAADLAEINRSKLDKKLTSTEMIVDLPASIDGQSVDTQAREILKNLGVDTNVYQSPIPNIIKWRRKADRIYNHEKGHWDPLHTISIQDEKHVMCLMTAKEFVALASPDAADLDNQDLEAHVLRLKSKFEDCTPIYLIEGLNAWMRKNKTIRNRAYQAAVLNQDGQGNSSGTTERQAPKRKKPADQYVDEDMIEDALLRLQVLHKCLIHHTAATVETVEWVANFTQHISTIPYKYVTPLSLLLSSININDRQERMNLDTSFCMESGQFHSGKDAHDTYSKMLQEVTRVTASVAQGITTKYPNILSLVHGFRKDGPTALEDIKVCETLVEGFSCTYADEGVFRKLRIRMVLFRTGGLVRLLARCCIKCL